ncbi:MAG: FAD-binding oxidoreductase, partial [Bacteroidota bacterium]
MENRFHSLKIKDIHRTTQTCSIISFEVPESLSETFEFIQGQYLTLRAQINGEEVRRSYSICSSPLDSTLKVGIKRIEDGRFSTYATEVLRVGDAVEVMPPNGKFFKKIEPDTQKNYVAIAAGSGITPIFSIIKT